MGYGCSGLTVQARRYAQIFCSDGKHTLQGVLGSTGTDSQAWRVSGPNLPSPAEVRLQGLSFQVEALAILLEVCRESH